VRASFEILSLAMKFNEDERD